MADVPRYAFGDVRARHGTLQLLKDGGAGRSSRRRSRSCGCSSSARRTSSTRPRSSPLVWKDTAVTDNALTRLIAQLRKTLGDEPGSALHRDRRDARLSPAAGRSDGSDPARAPAPADSEPVAAAPTPIAPTDTPLAAARSRGAGVLIAIAGGSRASRRSALGFLRWRRPAGARARPRRSAISISPSPPSLAAASR